MEEKRPRHSRTLGKRRRFCSELRLLRAFPQKLLQREAVGF